MTVLFRAGRALLAVSAALSAASGAHALSASAAIDWSGVQFALEDTAPDDGIAASYTTQFYTSALLCHYPGTCTVAGPSFADGFSAGSASVDTGAWQAAASFDGAGIASTISGRNAEGEDYFYTMRQFSMAFTGASRLTITVPYTLSVDPTGGDTLHGSFAVAGLGLEAGYANYYISSPWDGSFTHSGVLTMTREQAGGDFVSGLVWTAATLQFAPSLPPPIAAPVPEPASVALLMAGLGVVGVATRRRRSAPRA